MEEQAIIKGIKEDNVVCYEHLINVYSAYVVKVIMKVGGNQLSHEEVEELCADVFIKFWNNRVTLSIEVGKLKAYLGVMARNKTLNLLKGKNKKIAIPLEEDLIDYNSPETDLVQKEEKKLITEVLEGLPEPDGEIFIRRYFYMEKVIDIASTLGLNVQTVGTKLFRGKKKLEKALKERGVSYE